MAVYNACVLSTLLYGSETWTTYARQEKRLNTFHFRSLRCLLNIPWRDKVTNTDALSHGGLPTMYTLLRPLRRACCRAERCHWPQLRYKDVCKRDMKALDININSWEDLAADCTSWRSTLQTKQLQTGEEKLSEAAAEKWVRRMKTTANRPESTHNHQPVWFCLSCIGLHSHNRCCSSRADSLYTKGHVLSHG